jgi:predicted  nucleic acid-binding Zn-ribbon protein
MKEQIEILIKLQQIETEAANIQVMLKEVPDKLDSLDIKMEEFQQAVTAESEQLNDSKKNCRSLESDEKMNLSKIEKKQERLESVKSNKEYQALLKEIDELKAKNSQIEDEILVYLDQIEAAEKRIAAKKAEYSQLEKDIRAEKESLALEAEKGKQKIAEMQTETETVSKMADPDLLKKFNRIKASRGIGITSVVNAICQGCNMNIPAQLYNDLHRWDTLLFCPHCERIIYIDN